MSLRKSFRFSSPASMTSRLASVTFKMARKVFIEETDKNFEFITEILFQCLAPGDFKIAIIIENQTLVLLCNETSSGVIYWQSYRPVTLLRVSAQQSSKIEEFRHSNRRFIK